MKAYRNNYYADRDAVTRYSAQTILGLVRNLMPPIESAVDVGCGVGTWLSQLQASGVTRIQGVDGPWVNQELLVIPKKNFLATNLQQPIPLQQRFDLAISLEVAEHVPASCAPTFVESMVKLADVALFSAAIPHQGGKNHFNEQWPGYWARLFAGHGYRTIDAIRAQIWNDAKIPYWYRQNILLFAKESMLPNLTLPPGALLATGVEPLALVHPDLYLSKNPDTLQVGWTHFRRSIRSASLRLIRGKQ